MDSEATYGKLASRFIISMTQIADYGYILVPGLISLGIKKYYRHRDFSTAVIGGRQLFSRGDHAQILSLSLLSGNLLLPPSA